MTVKVKYSRYQCRQNASWKDAHEGKFSSDVALQWSCHEAANKESLETKNSCHPLSLLDCLRGYDRWITTGLFITEMPGCSNGNYLMYECRSETVQSFGFQIYYRTGRAKVMCSIPVEARIFLLAALATAHFITAMIATLSPHDVPSIMICGAQ